MAQVQPNPKPGYYTNYSYASQGRATAWQIESAMPGSGVLLRTLSGTLLCRVADGSVYFWDKFHRQEIQISIDHLVRMAFDSK